MRFTLISRGFALAVLLIISSVSKAQFTWLSVSGNNAYKKVNQFGGVVITGKTSNAIINQVPLVFAIDSAITIDSSIIVYDIDSIPDQLVLYNTPLRFYLKSSRAIGAGKQARQISFRNVVGIPRGLINTNRLNLFSYLTNSDTADFSIQFVLETTAGDTVFASKSTRFKIVPALPYETATFGVGNPNTSSLPDPESRDFTVLTVDSMRDRRGSQNMLNGLVLRTVSFSGVKVVLDKSNTANSLHLLDSTTNIDTLNLYAETLIIRGKFHFPQTTVRIFARDVIFEDKVNEFSQIITTPFASFIPGTTSGLKAGDIYLFAKSISANPGKRFILNGGDGQGGPSGDIGTPGDGGNLYSNINLQEYYLSDGGYSGGRRFQNGITYRGQPGSFQLAGNRASWYNANFFTIVVQYNRELFFNGLLAPVVSSLSSYKADLEDYISDSAIYMQPLEEVARLEQIVNDIDRVFYNISNNLDYYGNPPGWVPMLSYEVAASVYQTEARQAIALLYLDEMIKRANRSVLARQQAFRDMRNQTQASVASSRDEYYNIAFSIIPSINNEIDNNLARIEDLKAEVVRINDEIKNRAREKYEEQKLWGWIGGVANVLSMIPNPITQGIGSAAKVASSAFLNANQKRGFDNGTTLTNKIRSVVQPFTSGNFEKDVKGFATSLKDGVDGIFNDIQTASSLNDAINLGKKAAAEFEKNKAVAEKVSKSITSAVDLYNNVIKTSSDELGSITGEMIANEPRIGEIREEMDQIQQDQLRLSNQLQSASADMLVAQSSVESGLTAISQLSQGLFSVAQAYDQRLAIFAYDLRQKSFERLRKYHYYMVKAYEYRMLQAYPGRFGLNGIVNNIAALLQQDNDRVLNETDLNSLVSLYDNEIRTVISSLFDFYVSNSPKKDISQTIFLTSEEIRELNEGKPISINFVTKGLFKQNEEDIRINSIEVKRVVAKRIGQPGTRDNLDFVFTYPNYSRLKRDGIVYSFNNYNIRSQSPINWRSLYSFQDNTIAVSKTAASETSLLKSLLTGNNSASNDLLLFSRPAAWADITLIKSFDSDLATGVELDSVSIQIGYEYREKATSFVNVELGVDRKWFAPTFKLATDHLGRSSGVKNVHRYYRQTSAKIEAEAPLQYGRYRFKTWANSNGAPIQISSSVDTPSINKIRFTQASDRYFMATYEFDGALLNVPDTVYLQDTATTYNLFVLNDGKGLLNWWVDSVSDWISTNGVTGSENDTIFQLTVPRNLSTTTRRTGTMVIGSMETERIRTPIIFIQQPRVAATGPRYVFRGNGNWTNPANWLNGIMPPSVLPANSEIFIDPNPNGECILNVNLTIQPGAYFIVATGKRLRIIGNLNIQN
ncbi:hypothetical protein [Phnomibacter sp. MR]|uniref:hypothetical protein n=1 Tax=Phnomibacter sp. MR TaxID=3042318 RepID=UPI003A7F8A06